MNNSIEENYKQVMDEAGKMLKKMRNEIALIDVLLIKMES